MKTKIITILALAQILCFTASELSALEDKIFTSSGQILDGEEWNNVSIYNDDTIVDMLGGLVDSIGTHDTSTVNITGGHVNTLVALEFSTSNISNGFVYGLQAKDNSTVNFYDDARSLSLGSGGNFGTVNMIGGITEYLRAGDYGIINLYGGIVSEYLNAWDLSTVNIYGYSFNYNPIGGSWNGGQLKGLYLDNTPFTIDLYDMQTYNHLNLIPEPSTLILFLIGIFLIKRKT